MRGMTSLHLHALPTCCCQDSTLSPGSPPSKRARNACALPAQRGSRADNGKSFAKAFVGSATGVLRTFRNGWTGSGWLPLRLICRR
jgi:hypothetical protein